MSEPSDSELVEAARGGDRAALTALLERHHTRVLRFGMRMCRHPEDAEDVAQETLIAATRALPDFRGASSFSTWLYTIARSFCGKQRRRSKFAPAPESVEPIAETAAAAARSPEEETEGGEVRRALEDAIGELEPIYREVLVLRDVEGLSAPEVAEVVGASVDAVKSRLHRARVAVRARLAPVLGADLPPTEDVCAEVATLFSRKLEGDAPADLCQRMEAHVRACPSCERTCGQLRDILSLCRSL